MNTEKIRKLIKMLSSPNDGEIVAAARAILRILAQDGADIHELASRVGGELSQADMQRIYDQAYRDGKDAAAADVGFKSVDPPSFYEMACEIQQKGGGWLSEKEQCFIDDMVDWCAYREPSERQAKWLHSIYYNVKRRQR